MAEAKQKDLLKCKNEADIRKFAKDNRLHVSRRGNHITVGRWVCVMSGMDFKYIMP